MNATHLPSIQALRFGTALLSLGLFGCASTAMQFGTPREAMAKRVDATAAQVAEVNSRIDIAQRALDDLANHPAHDLKRQFGAYSNSVDQLESARDRLRADVEAMEKEGREYLVSWDREISTIRDGDLRNRTTDRRQEVAQRIDDLHARFIAARDGLTPVLNRFREIEKALKLDLTTAGIESIRPSVGETGDLDGARDALRELAESFRQASLSLAAAATPGSREANR